MKITLPLVTCFSVLCLTLAGCGGSDSNKNRSSSSAAVSSSVSSSAAANSSVSSVDSSSESSVAVSSDASSVNNSSEGSSESSSSEVSSESSSSETSSSSAASSSPWNLVWFDEFEGDAIDPAKWDHETNCWGGGNNEQQCYTDRSDNSFVSDGVLTIVAQKETFTGPNNPDGVGGGTATLPYTSARLRTKNLAEWTFGRFEVRAKLPQGQGSWPAFWMLPTDSPYGAWAGGGEIDIMEAVNLKAATDEQGAPAGTLESRVYGTLHYGRTWPNNVESGAGYKLPEGANPADDFHVYALEWEQGEMRWYVDGVHYATQRQEGWYSQYMVDGELTDAPVGAPFDEHAQFHLLLNLAVGGDWPANTNERGIDESAFPQTFVIDYVRVYECSAAPQTGLGCATIGDNARLVAGHDRPGIGPVNLDGPPQLMIYEDALFEGLKLRKYDPEGVVSYVEIEEGSRGNVINIVKTGDVGNAYINVNGDPADLRNWSSDSELIFDYKINSIAAGSTLLVKLDSGWPNVSDAALPVDTIGEWETFRITLADLINNGNSLAPGSKASLANIVNLFVVDSSGEMDVVFDNIRIEGTESEGGFAEPPLYNIFADATAGELEVLVFEPGNVTTSSTDEGERGSIFNVVKTAAAGNAQFNIMGGRADLSAWAASGELVFDVRVNSKAEGVDLLVKMDSGWPNVSDMVVDVAENGEWKTIRVGVASLIARGNSVPCCPGAADLADLVNIFVIEPTGAMDVSFDNIRLEVGEGGAEEFAPLPLFTVYGDSQATGLEINAWNDFGFIALSQPAEADRGNVFNVVKTGEQGNAFFTVQGGPVDLSHWSATGRLIFDVKVNSKDEGVVLRVKMDSGNWPNVSDMIVDVAPDGEWKTINVSVAELIANRNSLDPSGTANLSSITNIFVMEPSGIMDVSFDNIRLVVED